MWRARGERSGLHGCFQGGAVCDEKWEAAENRQIKLFLFSLFIVIDL